jgi:hypothetical protein
MPDYQNTIQRYLHCAKCLREKPSGQSPAEWARLNVGLTARGDVQVWCTRHDINVILLTAASTSRAC